MGIVKRKTSIESYDLLFQLDESKLKIFCNKNKNKKVKFVLDGVDVDIDLNADGFASIDLGLPVKDFHTIKIKDKAGLGKDMKLAFFY
jgi:hypothetical protein